MSLLERNRFLHILHRNRASRKQVEVIMVDLDVMGLFEEPEIIDDDDNVEFEEAMDIVFNKHKTPEEKRAALIQLKEEKISNNNEFVTSKLVVTDMMLYEKQQEMIALQLVEDGPDSLPKPSIEKRKKNAVTRFGRSPLHEAIALKDMAFVKRCIRQRLYLHTIDNNGNTPKEMAYFEWKEAYKLFVKAKI